MLLKFSVSNYKSINEEIEFSMFAGSYKRHTNHLIDFGESKILRSSAIYGTNGSGKTNVLLALRELQDLITERQKDVDRKLRIPIFKLSDCESEPTRFNIDFLTENKRFNYQLEIFQNKIRFEELNRISDDSKILIFKRDSSKGKVKLTLNPNRDKSQKEKYREEFYAEELPDSQTFFSDAYNRKIKEVNTPYNWFAKSLKFVSLLDHSPGLAHTFAEDDEFLKASKKIIKSAKVGIVDFKVVRYTKEEMKSLGHELPDFFEKAIIEEKANGIDFEFEGDLYSGYNKDGKLTYVKISTIHANKDGNLVEFKFSEESKGIQRLFELLPAIHRTLDKGEIFVIDEIETSFHPVLIKGILELYFEADPENSGQIIFTTHESHLMNLDLFRQDEIWFCEKDNNGSTKLYSLSEFKPRFDKDIRRGYLEGQFSYIPFLGSEQQLSI